MEEVKQYPISLLQKLWYKILKLGHRQATDCILLTNRTIRRQLRSMPSWQELQCGWQVSSCRLLLAWKAEQVQRSGAESVTGRVIEFCDWKVKWHGVVRGTQTLICLVMMHILCLFFFLIHTTHIEVWSLGQCTLNLFNFKLLFKQCKVTC